MRSYRARASAFPVLLAMEVFSRLCRRRPYFSWVSFIFFSDSLKSFICIVSYDASDFAVTLQATSKFSSLSSRVAHVDPRDVSTCFTAFCSVPRFSYAVFREPACARKAWWSVFTDPAISFTVEMRFTTPARTSY
jgi:hypothetical protein